MLRSYDGDGDGKNESYMQTYAPRFKAGQEIFIKYYVSKANYVALSITGYDLSGKKQTLTYALYAPGWNTAGTNCRIKRLTTIAQYKLAKNAKGEVVSTKVENFKSGAYLKNVKWSKSYIGTSSTTNHLWSSSDNSTDTSTSYKSAYCYPNSTKVSVKDYQHYSEMVSINLN